MDTLIPLSGAIQDILQCRKENPGKQVMIKFMDVNSVTNFSRLRVGLSNVVHEYSITVDQLKEVLTDGTKIFLSQNKTITNSAFGSSMTDNCQRWSKVIQKKTASSSYWKVYSRVDAGTDTEDTKKILSDHARIVHVTGYWRHVYQQIVRFTITTVSRKRYRSSPHDEMTSLDRKDTPKIRVTVVFDKSADLEKVLGLLFYNTKVDRLFFEHPTKTAFSPEIATQYRPQIELLTKYDPATLYVTPKVDGKTCKCVIRNGKAYVWSYINTAICYDTNVDSSHVIELVGEYIKIENRRIIYPFFVHSIDGRTVPDRMTQLSELGALLQRSDRHGGPDFVELSLKDVRFGFENTDALAKGIADVSEVSMPSDIPTDGAIVFRRTSNLDFKFRFDKSVDMLVTVNKTNHLSKRDGKQMLRLHTHTWDGTKFAFRGAILVDTEVLCLDVNMMCLIERRRNGLTIVAPLVAIAEIFEGPEEGSERRFRRIREDKTDLMYNRSAGHGDTKNGRFYYGGNPRHMVDLILAEVNMYTVEKLRKADFKAREDTVLPYLKVTEPKWVLNEGAAYYSEDDERQRRGDDLRVVSNFVTSNMIYNYLVPYIHGPVREVLDIDGGRGGVFRRLLVIEAVNVDLTDPNAKNIEMARERYNKLKENTRHAPGRTEQTSGRKRIFDLKTIVASLLDPNFASIVLARQKARRADLGYDLINVQFSIHYSLFDGKIVGDDGVARPSSSYDVAIGNIDALSKRGTIVLLTFMDGVRLKKLFDEKATDELRFNVYNDPSRIQYFTIEKYEDNIRNHAMGMVRCSSSSFASSVEYLVDPKKLRAAFVGRGYECLSQGEFARACPSSRSFYSTGGMFSITQSATMFMKTCGEANDRILKTQGLGLGVSHLKDIYSFLVLVKK